MNPVLALTLACLASFASLVLGLALAIRWSRRRAEEHVHEQLKLQLPVLHNLERAIRTGAVDRAAKQTQKKFGTAAFADVLIMGREITLVAASKDYLDHVVMALAQHREGIEQTMRTVHPVDTRPWDENAPPPPAPRGFSVLDGGVK